MLSCARIFLLKQLVQHLPVGVDATVARRRWVLAQVLPPCLTLDKEDLFVKVLRRLQHAETNIIYETIYAMLRAVIASREDLLPRRLPLYVVIDDAHLAADCVCDMYKFFKESGTVDGITISGTGLPMEIMKYDDDHHVSPYSEKIWQEK